MAKCRCHVINKNCLNHDYVDKNKAVILVTTAGDIRESSHCPQHDSGKVTSSDCKPFYSQIRMLCSVYKR